MGLKKANTIFYASNLFIGSAPCLLSCYDLYAQLCLHFNCHQGDDKIDLIRFAF